MKKKAKRFTPPPPRRISKIGAEAERVMAERERKERERHQAYLARTNPPAPPPKPSNRPPVPNLVRDELETPRGVRTAEAQWIADNGWSGKQ
jgi:hypothetical protein